MANKKVNQICGYYMQKLKGYTWLQKSYVEITPTINTVGIQNQNARKQETSKNWTVDLFSFQMVPKLT